MTCAHCNDIQFVGLTTLQGWPGLLECHGISLLVPILFPPVSFSMQLFDRGHHPYISTGFGENIFTSLVIIIMMVIACTIA